MREEEDHQVRKEGQDSRLPPKQRRILVADFRRLIKGSYIQLFNAFALQCVPVPTSRTSLY
jgi:hypothetical protein